MGGKEVYNIAENSQFKAVVCSANLVPHFQSVAKKYGFLKHIISMPPYNRNQCKKASAKDNVNILFLEHVERQGEKELILRTKKLMQKNKTNKMTEKNKHNNQDPYHSFNDLFPCFAKKYPNKSKKWNNKTLLML